MKEGRGAYGDTRKRSCGTDHGVQTGDDAVEVAFTHREGGTGRIGVLRPLNENAKDASGACTDCVNPFNAIHRRYKPVTDVPPRVGMKIPAGTLMPKVTMVSAPFTISAMKIDWMTGIACVGGSSTQSPECVFALPERHSAKRL